MRPTSDPLWNKEYVAQRLRDKKTDEEMRKIVARPIAVNNDADYWYGEYLDATNRCTELETENEKLRIIIDALVSSHPSARTISITEVWE